MMRPRPSIFAKHSHCKGDGFDTMQRARIDTLVEGICSLGRNEAASVVKCLCIAVVSKLDGDWDAKSVTDIGYSLEAINRGVR